LDVFSAKKSSSFFSVLVCARNLARQSTECDTLISTPFFGYKMSSRSQVLQNLGPTGHFVQPSTLIFLRLNRSNIYLTIRNRDLGPTSHFVHQSTHFFTTPSAVAAVIVTFSKINPFLHPPKCITKCNSQFLANCLLRRKCQSQFITKLLS
jgi:hypothetical protein